MFAHLTPAELPGTLALVAAGVALGVFLGRRPAIHPATLALAALAGVGLVLAALADPLGWPAATRLAIDAAWMAGSTSLLVAVWRESRVSPTGRRS